MRQWRTCELSCIFLARQALTQSWQAPAEDGRRCGGADSHCDFRDGYRRLKCRSLVCRGYFFFSHPTCHSVILLLRATPSQSASYL